MSELQAPFPWFENGNDRLLRIALCGYEGEGHETLLDYGWTVHAWRAAGGYGGGRGGTGDTNRHRERIYCGHETCHAFASWTPLPVSNVTPIAKATAAHADSWANREESTWIDKL